MLYVTSLLELHFLFCFFISRVLLDKMVALDLLAPVDPEDSLELWDSPDPRELL